MAIYKSLIIFLAFLFVAPIHAGKALSPDDIITISAEKEKQMGASISKKVEKEYKEVDDPLVEARFEEIGKKLAAVSDRQNFVYHFKVLKPKDEGEPEAYYNAFALPGGYIYMFEPLMKLMKTDENIAAVMAHELAHISARHAVKRLQSTMGANALMLLGLATARDGRSLDEANEALTHLMTAYSREEEFEADKISITYLKKAGFDTKGVTNSLMALRNLRKKGKEIRYMFYKTHPYLSERIAAVRKEIKGYADFDSYINIPERRDGVY